MTASYASPHRALAPWRDVGKSTRGRYGAANASATALSRPHSGPSASGVVTGAEQVRRWQTYTVALPSSCPCPGGATAAARGAPDRQPAAFGWGDTSAGRAAAARRCRARPASRRRRSRAAAACRSRRRTSMLAKPNGCARIGAGVQPQRSSRRARGSRRARCSDTGAAGRDTATELPDGIEPSNAGLLRTISASWSSLVKKKPADVGVPEVGEHRVGQARRRARDSARSCVSLEDVEQRGDEERVVVEVAVELGDAVLAGAEQAVAALQLALRRRRRRRRRPGGSAASSSTSAALAKALIIKRVPRRSASSRRAPA